MIIRLSETKDINGIIALWNEAFGDSENEIRFFLNRKYIAENTLVVEENGEIASMLFLLEGNMCIKGVDYPSYYLYAACTLREYRGRGFMAMLLDEAKRIADSRNIDFICLMPGEKSLYGFYEKFGYKTVFNKKVLCLEVDSHNTGEFLNDETATDYETLRNDMLSAYDYFKWDEQSIRFAVDHNEMYSGKHVVNCNGYCLYTVNDGGIAVKESAFTSDKLLEFVEKIAVLNGCEKIKINLPSEYPSGDIKSEIVPSGMILAVNERSKIVSDGLNNAYLGLTLD